MVEDLETRVFRLESQIRTLLDEIEALHDNLLRERKRNAKLMGLNKALREEEAEKTEEEEEKPVPMPVYAIGQPTGINPLFPMRERRETNE